MSEINKALLRKVRNKILRAPSAYDQSTYGMPSEEAPCGAACCLLGWADILAGGVSVEHVAKDGWDTGIYGRVQASLGLTDDEFSIVADGGAYSWPMQFSDRYREAKWRGDRKGMARAAADYLNYIIRTGKVK